MSGWLIYLIVLFNNFCFTMGMIALLSLFGSIVVGLVYLCLHTERPVNEDLLSKLGKSFKLFVTGFCLFGLLSCFIPNTKELAAIYLIPKISKNENIQQIPDNISELLNTKLEEWISDSLKESK